MDTPSCGSCEPWSGRARASLCGSSCSSCMCRRVGSTPVNSVAVLLEASRGATSSDTTPGVLADAGVENVNAQVDDLITTGMLRHVLAFTELKFLNSMIEAWWRSLKTS